MPEPSLLPNQSQEEFLPTSHLPLQVTPTSFSPLPATGMQLPREFSACLSLLSRSLLAVRTVCEPWPLHPVGLPPEALQADTPRPVRALVLMQPAVSSQALGSESGMLSRVLANEHPPLQPSRQAVVVIFVVVAGDPIFQNSHVESLLWCAKPSCARKTSFPSPPSSGSRAPANHPLQVP